ncbi:MAG: nitroreductase family deazaflavin-dependent oxidoreductase [Deltaproteobacteria bacterium]|nr:nitroreductase family deazaflavin-dependent oxidoreductase [Deltaproteobacteria bacterium]
MYHRAIATLGLCILAAAHTGCMTAFAAFQPENIGGATIVITTTGADGESYDRVLSPIDDDGQLVVAANHWPRAWYHRALENPDVRVTREGEITDYRAVPVRQFLRLEPR